MTRVSSADAAVATAGEVSFLMMIGENTELVRVHPPFQGTSIS